jgi:tetratricopeptide (TPR) repeat protein
MYKIIPVIILSALLCMKAFSFNSYDFEGNEKKLLNMPPDTNRAKLLIDLGEKYCSRDFEKALLFLQEALVLSTELNYKRGIACSMLWQGRAYYYKDKYDLAYEYLEKARLILEETAYIKGLAQYHFAIGAIHNINGNDLSAIRDFQEVVRLSEMSGDKQQMAIGYHSLGSLHLQRSETDLAIRYFQEALALNREAGHQLGELTNLKGIGMVYESLEMNDSALFYFEGVMEIMSAMGEPRGIASMQLIIGKLLLKTGHYREAREMFETSMSIFSSLNDDTGICLNMYKLAEALHYLGYGEKALENSHAALAIARRINNPSLVRNIYASMASLMAGNGNYREAYDYNIRGARLKDSLAAANREKVIRELELKFQVSEKDNEIKLWKSRNEIQTKNNLILTISIMAMAAILLLLLFLYRMKTNAMKRRRKIYEQENTIHCQQSELKDKEQQLLEKQLEVKNRELASKALEMLRMNETIGDIIEKLESFSRKKNVSEELYNEVNGIVAGLEAQLRDNSWNEFEKIFKNIHSDFFQRLLIRCPDLTPAEIKVAAFLKLNLSTKEIAAVTYKSEAGIKSTRYRLRKKLGLQSDDSLVPCLIKL